MAPETSRIPGERPMLVTLSARPTPLPAQAAVPTGRHGAERNAAPRRPRGKPSRQARTYSVTAFGMSWARRLEHPLLGRRADGRYPWFEAQLAGERPVHAARPRVDQGLRRLLDRIAGELGHLEDGHGCVIGDVDDPPVHRPGQGEARGGGDVALVDDGVCVGGM